MADGPKSFFLSSEMHDYIRAHSTPTDDIQDALIAETKAKVGGLAIMQISPEQGAFMQLLVAAVGARHVVEVGTFTGYSALCMARALPADGKLVCLDVSDEWTSIGRPYWERAGVADRINLLIAPAIDSLRAMPTDAHIDLAFIDADKENYIDYYEELITRLRPGGLILCDNVMWNGSVVSTDPEAGGENRVHIMRFNDHVAADERTEKVMLAVGDGLTVVRKR